MSATGDPSEQQQPGAGSRPEDHVSEEELRAAYEAEIKKIRVEQVLLEQVVTLVNLGMRRTGLVPGTESERDPDQVRIAIEAVRVLAPLVEQVIPQQAGPIRDALSQLQLAFVRIGGAPGPAGAGAPPSPGEGGPGGPPDRPGGPGGLGRGGPGGPDGGVGGVGGPGGGAGGPGGSEPPPAKPGEPGPAQRSGRLWIPGQ